MGVLLDTVRFAFFCLILFGNVVYLRFDRRRRRGFVRCRVEGKVRGSLGLVVVLS